VDSDFAWIALAVVASACAVYTLRTARPVRRAPGESSLSVYFREYWNPWCVVFGVRVFDEDPSAVIFGTAVAVLALVSVTAAIDRRDRLGGPGL
jgi:hypothetical protein